MGVRCGPRNAVTRPRVLLLHLPSLALIWARNCSRVQFISIQLLNLAAGIASDPQKLARFRVLMRVRSGLPAAVLQTPALRNFSRMLMKVTQLRCIMHCHALCMMQVLGP